MAKQRRTLDERIQSYTTKEEEMLEKLKQYQAQRKQLEKQKKAEERKIRTQRLIQIGGVVESVLGRPVEPTIHEGFRATQMEQRGEVSDRCEYNRIIKQLNSVTKEWFQTMKGLPFHQEQIQVLFISRIIL